jgi:NADPH-dependent curcumin reductase CurA
MSFNEQQNQQQNRQIKLASRPNGAPTKDNFELTISDIPTPNDKQMLLRTVYMSLDPYMRGRMSASKSYADPLEVGDVMLGGTVAQVVESNIDKFAVGDLVVSNSGWQDYSVSDGEGVLKLDKNMSNRSKNLTQTLPILTIR